MPVSAVSPYVPDAIFSEDRSEELRLILDGIELQLRMGMGPRQERLLKKHGVSKIVKLTDWSSVAGVTDVTLSRYNNGHSRPPLALIQFLRHVFERVEENPQKGIGALIDYLGRKDGPSIEDISFAGEVVEASEIRSGHFSISASIDIAGDSNAEGSSEEGPKEGDSSMEESDEPTEPRAA